MKKRFFAATLLAFTLVIGALPATAFAGDIDLQSVAITLTEPSAGNLPDTSPTVVADYDAAVSIDQETGVKWVVSSTYTGNPSTTYWKYMDETTTAFEAGKYYAVSIMLDAEDGYAITSDTAVTVNGHSPNRAAIGEGYIVAVFVFGPLPEAHTHTYNPDVWSNNASQHWHECTDANCTDKAGSIKDVADHTFAWVVDREATATEEGLKHEACTVCGFTRSENTAIAKIDASKPDASKLAPAKGTPKTGDTTNIAVPIAILLIGGAIVGAAVFLRKKRADK